MSNRWSATSGDSFVWSGRENTNRLKVSISDIMFLYVSPSIDAGMLASSHGQLDASLALYRFLSVSEEHCFGGEVGPFDFA